MRIFARCSQVQKFVLHKIGLLREFYSVEQALCDVPLNELVVEERLSVFDSEKAGVFFKFYFEAALCVTRVTYSFLQKYFVSEPS